MQGRKPIPAGLRLITATRDNKRGKLTAEKLTKNKMKAEPGIPDPPDELGVDALEEWNRISPPLYNLGVLTKYDRAILSLYCQQWGVWREAQRIVKERGLIVLSKTGIEIQNPALGIANRAGERCAKYAIELGLTPSARSRIDTKGLNARAAEQEEADVFAEFSG